MEFYFKRWAGHGVKANVRYTIYGISAQAHRYIHQKFILLFSQFGKAFVNFQLTFLKLHPYQSVDS
jgi:hypothetical protein